MDNYAYADIVILALVAGFILLRLRAILGQKNGLPPQLPRDFVLEKEIKQVEGEILDLKASSVEEEKVEDFVTNHAALSDTLKSIRKKDPSFRASQFLEGAKAAFEMILDGFARQDRKTLRSSLGKDLYKVFEDELARQEKSGKLHVSTLIAIKESLISNASLQGNTVQLTVHFVSEQMESVKDLNGVVLESSRHVERIEDSWIFERKISSQDPNWSIIKIDGIG